MNRLFSDYSDSLATLLNRGFIPPFYGAAISMNGSLIFFKCEIKPAGNLDSSVIISHFEDDKAELPMNIMFVDSRGEAARVVIDKSGEQYIH